MCTFPRSDKFQSANQVLCFLLLLQPLFRKQYPTVALPTLKNTSLRMLPSNLKLISVGDLSPATGNLANDFKV